MYNVDRAYFSVIHCLWLSGETLTEYQYETGQYAGQKNIVLSHGLEMRYPHM